MDWLSLYLWGCAVIGTIKVAVIVLCHIYRVRVGEQSVLSVILEIAFWPLTLLVWLSRIKVSR